MKKIFFYSLILSVIAMTSNSIAQKSGLRPVQARIIIQKTESQNALFHTHISDITLAPSHHWRKGLGSGYDIDEAYRVSVDNVGNTILYYHLGKPVKEAAVTHFRVKGIKACGTIKVDVVHSKIESGHLTFYLNPKSCEVAEP